MTQGHISGIIKITNNILFSIAHKQILFYTYSVLTMCLLLYFYHIFAHQNFIQAGDLYLFEVQIQYLFIETSLCLKKVIVIINVFIQG